MTEQPREQKMVEAIFRCRNCGRFSDGYIKTPTQGYVHSCDCPDHLCRLPDAEENAKRNAATGGQPEWIERIPVIEASKARILVTAGDDLWKLVKDSRHFLDPERPGKRYSYASYWLAAWKDAVRGAGE